MILLLPAMASVLPQQWWVHPLILALAMPLASFALWRGWHQHRNPRPAMLGGVGLILLAMGVLAGEGGNAEIALTVIGGLTLVGAHLLNWRLDDHRSHAHVRVKRPPTAN